ncbi:hypothetical protein RFI_29244 [Reticulomyxa filosa]|uniref:Uncharacterized protein n=1 Tax=Reticulomyxa filosa TaxID=46433 RepID=X6M2L7_RETFI|nr:hypothetical protein RFI_29244 [Reticulomyxa filosa]|eukprot:ETO08144.1 hypothetical protein RFI_29244 [Reticulomyxa filosa]
MRFDEQLQQIQRHDEDEQQQPEEQPQHEQPQPEQRQQPEEQPQPEGQKQQEQQQDEQQRLEQQRLEQKRQQDEQEFRMIEQTIEENKHLYQTTEKERRKCRQLIREQHQQDIEDQKLFLEMYMNLYALTNMILELICGGPSRVGLDRIGVTWIALGLVWLDCVEVDIVGSGCGFVEYNLVELSYIVSKCSVLCCVELG